MDKRFTFSDLVSLEEGTSLQEFLDKSNELAQQVEAGELSYEELSRVVASLTRTVASLIPVMEQLGDLAMQRNQGLSRALDTLIDIRDDLQGSTR